MWCTLNLRQIELHKHQFSTQARVQYNIIMYCARLLLNTRDTGLDKKDPKMNDLHCLREFLQNKIHRYTELEFNVWTRGGESRKVNNSPRYVSLFCLENMINNNILKSLFRPFSNAYFFTSVGYTSAEFYGINGLFSYHYFPQDDDYSITRFTT